MSDLLWILLVLAIALVVVYWIYTLARNRVTFQGGPGDVVERAVIIRGARNETVGVRAEYRYLARKFGRPGVDWRPVGQGLVERGDRHYDEMHIELAFEGSGTQRTIFFDITQFFGKGSEDIPPPW